MKDMRYEIRGQSAHHCCGPQDDRGTLRQGFLQTNSFPEREREFRLLNESRHRPLQTNYAEAGSAHHTTVLSTDLTTALASYVREIHVGVNVEVIPVAVKVPRFQESSDRERVPLVGVCDSLIIRSRHGPLQNQRTRKPARLTIL